MSFILGKGDYIELKGFTLEERKNIQLWMEGQGNRFCSTIYKFTSRSDEVLEFSEYFQNVEKNCRKYPNKNNRTQELVEAMKKDQQEVLQKPVQELPEEFIIVNADNLAVRQWLKDKGYTWNSGGELTTEYLDHKYLASVKSWNNGEKHLIVDNFENNKYEFEGLPVIIPTIGVTGFTIEQPETTSQKEIHKMEAQIKELQESLNKLKAEQGN